MVFKWDFISGEMKYFQCGVLSISYNCLHEVPRKEFPCGHSDRNFHLLGERCKHYPKIKLHRTSHRKCSVKKGVTRNFTKFTGKYLCQRLFFNKIEGLRPATLLKKRLCHRCFPLNIVKFLRTPFCIEHLWWLLLIIVPWLSERKHLRMRILHKNQDRRSKVQNNVNFITFCPPWN